MSQLLVQSKRTRAAPRPLPSIPHLTLVRPAGVRSYRPLPTLPLQPADASFTSSTESVYPQVSSTHSTSLVSAFPLPHDARGSSSSFSSFASSSSASSESSSKPRPKLRISIASPTPRRRNSLDSLTVRSPALHDPGQTLSPMVDCRLGGSKHSPHVSKRISRVSVVNSVVSPMVFEDPRVITESDTSESEEAEPISSPHIPKPECSIPNSILILQPPQPRLTSTLTDRISIDYPVPAFGVVIDTTSEPDSDDETGGLNPRTMSSTDLTNGHRSHASDRRVRTPFLNVVRVTMKSHLFRTKARSAKFDDAPPVDAKRVSQMAPPLNQTWYKERDGWRWVERDVGEVLAELRKLR